MGQVIPIPVWPNIPTGADLKLFKDAKKVLDDAGKINVLIKPVRAVPGSPFGVIALRERPNFVCKHILLNTPDIPSVANAIEWIVTGRSDARVTDVTYLLKEIFGPEVTEIECDTNPHVTAPSVGHAPGRKK